MQFDMQLFWDTKFNKYPEKIKIKKEKKTRLPYVVRSKRYARVYANKFYPDV